MCDTVGVKIRTRSRRECWSMTSLPLEGLKQLLQGTASTNSYRGLCPLPPPLSLSLLCHPQLVVCVWCVGCRCKVLDSLAVVEFLRQKLQDQEQTQVVLVSLDQLVKLFPFLPSVLPPITCICSNNSELKLLEIGF